MKCNRCGKENVDPVYPHTCTPLALKLADDLEATATFEMPFDWIPEELNNAAAEFRRLAAVEAENEALREANNTFATANILPDHLTIVDKAEVDALREVLKALIHLEHNARASGADMGLALDVARAALARAGGEK